MTEYAVALDVGGTFTDVTLIDLHRGRMWNPAVHQPQMRKEP